MKLYYFIIKSVYKVQNSQKIYNKINKLECIQKNQPVPAIPL